MVDEPVERRRGMDDVTQRLAAMHATLEGFAEAAEQMVPRDRFEHGRRQLFVASGMVALVVASIGFFNLLALQSSQDTLDRLEDCTTPGGECYRDLVTGDGNTAREAVRGINARLDSLRCLLLILPENRTGETIAPCLNEGGDR